MVKVRAMSPNVLNQATSYWHDKPVLRTIYWYTIQFRSFVINLFRRKNIIRMRSLNAATWYDSDTRVFEACFQILADYVEKELAWMQLLTEGKSRWYHRWFPIRNGRELGLRYLHWEAELGADSPIQSESAKTIRELYLWYRDVYQNRPDPFDSVPDRDFKLTPTEDGMYMLEPETDEYYQLLTAAADIEQAQLDEMTAQLVRLVQVRGSMWT